jgi:ssDNA-binding Zn-finger/Zn-ribbon topoisomerase 1
LVYLSQAKLLFEDDRGWGPVFDNILDGEFQGQCPDCKADFHIVAGRGFGFFVTADEWINNAKAQLVSITPALPDQLDGIELWLFKTLSARGSSEFTRALLYFFGDSTCPMCRNTVKLPDAIKKAVAC